jgi:hypothetical protein
MPNTNTLTTLICLPSQAIELGSNKVGFSTNIEQVEQEWYEINQLRCHIKKNTAF